MRSSLLLSDAGRVGVGVICTRENRATRIGFFKDLSLRAKPRSFTAAVSPGSLLPALASSPPHAFPSPGKERRRKYLTDW